MKNKYMLQILLAGMATSTALMAGLFFAWSVSVMPGLARLQDAEFIAAMQAMNRAILNGVFFSAFMGTLVLLPLSAFYVYGDVSPVRFRLLLAASLVYAIGVFGVTMGGNVPLNDALAAFRLRGATAEAMAAARKAFEVPWNRLNTVRTMAALVAIVLVLLALTGPAAGGLSVGAHGGGTGGADR